MSIKLFVPQIISWVTNHHLPFQFIFSIIGAGFFILAVIKTPPPNSLYILLGYLTLIANFILFDFLSSLRLKEHINQRHEEFMARTNELIQEMKNARGNS